MKNTVYILLLIPIIISITGCKKEKKETCYTCKYNELVMNYGEDVSIRIANVITPNNFTLCDSMVYIPQLNSYVEPSVKYSYMKKVCTVEERRQYRIEGNDSICPCVENEDKQYNDAKNQFLYIDGIDKFPYNKVIIYIEGETVPLITYNNYKNDAVPFNAFVADTLQDGRTVTFKHVSGNFTYIIKLYNNLLHTDLYDELTGGFTVIRKPQDCPTTGCKGRDADDPLLD